jgi:hypothetical protein
MFCYVAGYDTGGLNTGMHGPLTGVRGPFTPSQWMELEHQALIYKYITARVPVPSNLIIPLKKSVYPYSLPGSSTGSFPHNSCNLFPFLWNTLKNNAFPIDNFLLISVFFFVCVFEIYFSCLVLKIISCFFQFIMIFENNIKPVCSRIKSCFCSYTLIL